MARISVAAGPSDGSVVESTTTQEVEVSESTPEAPQVEAVPEPVEVPEEAAPEVAEPVEAPAEEPAAEPAAEPEA